MYYILALQPTGYSMRPKILKSFCCPLRGSDNANISFNMLVVSSGGGKFVIGILTYMFGGNDEGPLMKVVSSLLRDWSVISTWI